MVGQSQTARLCLSRTAVRLYNKKQTPSPARFVETHGGASPFDGASPFGNASPFGCMVSFVEASRFGNASSGSVPLRHAVVSGINRYCLKAIVLIFGPITGVIVYVLADSL